LRIKTFECPTCRRTEFVNAYISDGERMALDVKRQMAGNAALKQLRADGVPCHRCGAKNPVHDPTAVQIVCAYCRAAILLSDHVAADAIARARLKEGLYGMMDDLQRGQKERDRRVLIGVLVGVGVALAVTTCLVALQAQR
jgi:hypothetical protein